MTIVSEIVKRHLTVEAPVYGGELPAPELDETENARRDQAYCRWLRELSWDQILALLVQEQDERERRWALEEKAMLSS